MDTNPLVHYQFKLQVDGGTGVNRGLVNIKTRHIFREYMVNWWTLRNISDEFDSAEVPCHLEYEPPEPGQRRTLIEQYYHAVDWSNWRDVKKVLKVYESVLQSVLETEELTNSPQLTTTRRRAGS